VQTKSASIRQLHFSSVSVCVIVLELFFDSEIGTGDKAWLETHLWHAKRMHMENMWGYRLVCYD
jgi:hypothetical protein